MHDRSLRDVAGAIEYTDLRKEITYRDVETMCTEAVMIGFHAVVLPSSLVSRASRDLRGVGSDVAPLVATVISYPFGTQAPGVKAREAAAALEAGAQELDIAPHFGAILSGDWRSVREELSEIRRSAGDAILKLMLETGRLQPEQIAEVCQIAADEGFRFATNTLGFRVVSTDPTAEGTATAENIRSLRSLAAQALGIKASGGVSGMSDVLDLLDAGADRVTVPVKPGLLRAMERESA